MKRLVAMLLVAALSLTALVGKESAPHVPEEPRKHPVAIDGEKSK